MDVLLGLQWGDEGKGKIVDVLAPQYEVVARFQGGPNAGHTLEFDGIKHVLHQIPSGIFRSQILNIIGNGVVLDPIILKKEIEALIKEALPDAITTPDGKEGKLSNVEVEYYKNTNACFSAPINAAKIAADGLAKIKFTLIGNALNLDIESKGT